LDFAKNFAGSKPEAARTFVADGDPVVEADDAPDAHDRQTGRTSTVHFRVFDLAAERCVWSIPPIDTVPWKLRTENLVVRSIDHDGEVVAVVRIDGLKLEDLLTQLLADERAARLDIYLAADKSYAGRAVRFSAQ